MLTKSSLLALLLAVVHVLSGLTLLLVSSWFIAASAVAGVNFNYMLPAVVIRALALMRIASGYGEMWLSHHQLLDSLANIRLRLFNDMKGRSSASRASDTDKLNYQSEDVASIWTGWINQNAGALLALLLLSGFVMWQLVMFSSAWFIFLIGALSIYTWLIMSGLSLAYKKLKIRTELEFQIEHHFDAASIWHMQKHLEHPNASVFYNNLQVEQKKIEWAISGLLVISLLTVTVLIMKMDSLGNYSPIVMILPMALLASVDWFGRTFFSHHRLHDYIIGKKGIDSERTNEVITRLEDKIHRLELKQFKPAGGLGKAINTVYKKQELHLISGSSGSGKSRLFQAISGLIDYDGELILNSGSIVNSIPKTKNKKPAEKQLLDDVLYVEQTPYCLSGTLRQNLELAQKQDTSLPIKAAVTEAPVIQDSQMLELLNSVGLRSLSNLNQWVGTGGRQLSGGETKRLGLVRAMLSTKSVLLLDEPFEGLDESNINKVVNVINNLKQTRCVIIASHIYPQGLVFDSVVDLDSL